MVPMHGIKAVGAFHEPQDASLANEQVVHLGFMVPMHGKNGERAFHKPHERRVRAPIESGGGPPHLQDAGALTTVARERIHAPSVIHHVGV